MKRSSFRIPNLDFYRQKAKHLVKLHSDCDPTTLRLIKYNHKRFSKLGPADIAERSFSLRDAQSVVASVDGYGGWSALQSHVKKLNSGRDNASLLFEQAAEAVVEGQLAVLESLLNRHPELVIARSQREYQSTLLHYIAANGIEDHRQKTPANAVAIAELLLEHGSEPDALANTYGGGTAQTTLSLLVSSGWPNQAGLQGDLVRVLCKYGAEPDGLDNDGLPLATALVFFYSDTARALAEAGARTDHLLAAAAVGKPRDVDACFTESGRLRKGRKGNFVYIGFELRPPRNRLEMLGQAFVYSAMCGNLPTMKRLHSKHKCPVDAVADRGICALHLAAYKGHSEVVEWLLKKGANATIRDKQWNSTPVTWAFQSGQRKIRNRIIDSIDLDLHMAVSFFRLRDVKRVLKSDPGQASQRNPDGLLPIHCLHDDTEDGPAIIEQLIKAGADVNELDPDGRTPIDRLLVHGRKDLIAILKKHGGRRGRRGGKRHGS